MTDLEKILQDKLMVRRLGEDIKNLLDKFSSDGYIKCQDDLSPSEFVFNEIIAFLNLPVYFKDYNISEELILKYFYSTTEMFAIAFRFEVYKEFSQQYANQIHENSALNTYISQGFTLLNNFDKYAQANDGEFYKNIKIANPGLLTELYFALLTGAKKIVEEEFEDDPDYFDDKIKEFRELIIDFIDEAISEMRKEQLKL